MSSYTSLGVTVSPDAAVCFLEFLRTLADRPDSVCRGGDGSVSAVWEDRNRFDVHSEDSEYSKIIDFLEDLGDKNFIYESVTEDCEPVVRGAYIFGFARVVRYDMNGLYVDLNGAVF